MFQKPLISIGVPIYNVQEYLSNCIESIMRQTYTNLEILLIDDGSTDQSGLIADQYVLEDSRINVIHNPNQGLSAARNQAAALARGKYIIFIDSDDFVSDEYVSHLYDLIEQHQACMASVGMLKFVEETDVYLKDEAEKITVFENDEIIKHSISIPNRTWAKIYKTELIKENLTFINPFNDTGEDNILAVDLLKVYKKVVLSDCPLYFWRYTVTGITSTSSKLVPYTMLFLGNRFVGNREFVDWCQATKPELEKYAKVRLAYTLCGEYNLVVGLNHPDLDHRAYVWYMKKFLRQNLRHFMRLKEVPTKIKLWFIASAYFPKWLYRLIQMRIMKVE